MLVLGSAAATDSVAAVVEVDVQHWHNQHNIPEWSFPVQNNQIYPGTAEIWIQHLYSYKYWVNKTGYMVDKCPNCDSSHTTSQLFNFQSDQPHSQGSMGKTCKNCQISKSGNICWWSQLEEPKLQNERCFHLKNKIIKKKTKSLRKQDPRTNSSGLDLFLMMQSVYELSNKYTTYISPQSVLSFFSGFQLWLEHNCALWFNNPH